MLTWNAAEQFKILRRVSLARGSRIGALASINAAGTSAQCPQSIKFLSVTIASGITINDQISSAVSACNYHLRTFRRIRRALTTELLAETIGRTTVLSRLDYCNSLFIRLSQSNLDRLQTVQNQCVRIIKWLPNRANTSSARAQMHRLPVRERIAFQALSAQLHSSLISPARVHE
jgi:hypothetical protein